MADVNEVRGIEQQQGQGAYNPNLYAENKLDVRLEQQPWQAQANANAQRFVPTFEESGTNNGANEYAPQQKGALDNKANYKSGEAERKAEVSSSEPKEHMDKLPADATEDESAGSFGGDGESSTDSGERTPRDRERERAKEVFESIGGTAAPRTFNSVGEAATEALKVLRHQ